MKIKESEEKMKNSFDSNKKDEMEGVLPTGEKIEIIGYGNYKTPDIPESHTIANKNVKKRVREKSKLDVGIGSSGFTSMITLASIIVIAGIIIAYIIFKV